MKAEKIDRRIKYTKQVLRESLLELLNELPIGKISVKMICEKADLNRSTFYVYYKDQFDLLEQLELEAINSLRQHITKEAFLTHNPETLNAMHAILDYIQKDAALFKVLLGPHGSSSFYTMIMEFTEEELITELLEALETDQATAAYVKTFAVNGALSLLKQWLDNDFYISSEAMSKLAAQLIYTGVSTFKNQLEKEINPC